MYKRQLLVRFWAHVQLVDDDDDEGRKAICDALWKAYQWLSSETKSQIEQPSRHLSHFCTILAILFFCWGIYAKKYCATVFLVNWYTCYLNFSVLGAVLANTTLWWLDLHSSFVLLYTAFFDYFFRLRSGLWVLVIAIKLLWLSCLVFKYPEISSSYYYDAFQDILDLYSVASVPFLAVVRSIFYRNWCVSRISRSTVFLGAKRRTDFEIILEENRRVGTTVNLGRRTSLSSRLFPLPSRSPPFFP